MIVNIGWKDFQIKFLKGADAVYVIEDEYTWTFYVAVGAVVIKTFKAKMDNQGERVNFVDLYLTGLNVVKCESVDEQMNIKIGMYQE